MKGVVLSTLTLALLLSGVPSHAVEVVVRVGPPVAVVEHPAPPPAPRGYVWVPGYHAWDGHAYHWTQGYWTRPPRPHARWVPARWVRRPRGYVFVQGHWR